MLNTWARQANHHYQPSYVGVDWEAADHEAGDRADLLILGMHGYTKTGIIGRPSLASPAKSEALVRQLIAVLGPHLDLLRRTS